MREVKGPGKRITLADVAREAGVSVQTASHVLAGNMTVRLPEATRKRVADAAQKVGYRPNRMAQAMQGGKTRIISVWIPVDRIVPTYMRFLKAINAKARESGYDLMITGLDSSMAYAAEGRPPNVWPVDGVIAVDAGKSIEVFRADPQNDKTPVVVLGLETFSNSDAVSWDVAAGAKASTQMLIASGCRRIVHVTLDWVIANFPREQRRKGYTEAMVAAGLKPEFLEVADESRAAAEASVLALLGKGTAPDAFFCFTDVLAVGTVRALLNSGIQVPNDCQVCGFGNYPDGEDYRVPLTTLQIPVESIVDQAWQWLMGRIQNPNLERRLALLPMVSIERDSTKK